jgi:hypothetical protein
MAQKTTDIALTSMVIREVTEAGGKQARFILEWERGLDANRGVIGAEMASMLWARGVLMEIYGPLEDLINCGICELHKGRGSTHRQNESGIHRWDGESHVTIKAEASGYPHDISISQAALVGLDTGFALYILPAGGSHTISAVPVITNIHRQSYSADRQRMIRAHEDKVQELIALLRPQNPAQPKKDRRLSLRAAEIIGSTTAPTITESAEYAVILLGVAEAAQGNFSEMAVQEIVDYARKILEGVRDMKMYEAKVHQNLIDAIKAVVEPSAMAKIEARVAEAGLHLSSYAGAHDEIHEWRRDALQTVVRSAQEGEARCLYCGPHEVVHQLPGKYFTWLGKPLAVPIQNLTAAQVVATLILRGEETASSPYKYILDDADPKLIAQVIEASNWGIRPTYDAISGYLSLETMEALASRCAAALGSLSGLTNVGTRQHIQGSPLDDDMLKKHVIAVHGDHLMLPPEIPTLKEILDGIVDNSVGRTIMGILKSATRHDLPIARSTVFIPATWQTPVPPPIYVEYLVRRSYYASLEMSEARLVNALDIFHEKTNYDGMAVFSRNTSILSGNRAFDRVSPVRPIRPHQFQLDYLNRMLKKIVDAVLTTKPEEKENDVGFEPFIGIEDPTIVIDLAVLAVELGLHVSSSLETDAMVSYTDALCAEMTQQTGVSILLRMFDYARAASISYRNATVSNHRNQQNLVRIACIVLRRTRRMKPYLTLKEDLLTEDQKFFDTFLSSRNGLVREAHETVQVAAQEDSGSFASPVTTGQPSPSISAAWETAGDMSGILDESPAEFHGIERNSGSVSPIMPTVTPVRLRRRLTMYEELSSDIAMIRRLVARAAVSDEMVLMQNLDTVQITYLKTIAGSGKTTVAIMAAALAAKAKQLFRLKLPYNFEVVFVCDQSLVRLETYQKVVALNGAIRATCIVTDANGGVQLMSNFTEQGTYVQNGKTKPCVTNPRFKCATRDMIIMASEHLIPYVLGRKDTGTRSTASEGLYYGNPRAFVIIDEFGAKLGDIETIRSLADTYGEKQRVADAFRKMVPAMPILANIPSIITVLGASLPPIYMLRDTISTHQGARAIEKPYEDSNGKIYVGSQYELANGEEIHIWSICHPNLIGSLINGLLDSLLKRTLGHRAVVALREQIKEMIDRGGRSAERLREMEEYVNYDLGTYTGDSIANYAIGLLYFMYLYAHRYIGPAPELSLLAGDMVKIIDAIPGRETPVVPLDPYAPWPRTHFARASEMYRSIISPASPTFLSGIGIRSKWSRKVPYGALLAARSRALVAAINTLEQKEPTPEAPMGFHERVARFYEFYAPEKVARASELVQNNDEEKLMKALIKKYGPEPTGKSSPTTGKPAPTIEDVADRALKELRQELAESVAAIQEPDETSIEDAKHCGDAVARDTDNHTWTTFGAAVRHLREASKNREDRNLRLFLDPEPGQAAIRIIAALVKKTEKQVQEDSVLKIQEQRRILESKEEHHQRLTAEVERGLRGGSNNETEEARDGRTVTRRIDNRLDSITANELLTAAEGRTNSAINPYTGNRYLDLSAPRMNGDSDLYLLSFGIVCLSASYGEYWNSEIYSYLKKTGRSSRITLVIMDAGGCYGLNPNNATIAIMSPRAGMHVSTQTLHQFACRVGRAGTSDDATVIIDTLTLMRILEASIHTGDAALFPNIALALDEMRSEADVSRWAREVDAAAAAMYNAANAELLEYLQEVTPLVPAKIRHLLTPDTYRAILTAAGLSSAKLAKTIDEIDRLVLARADAPDAVYRATFSSELTRRLTVRGQTNADCELLPFILGALLLHIHEPLGVADLPGPIAWRWSGSSGSRRKLGAIWPRVPASSDGSSPGDALMLVEVLGAVALHYSQARDQSGYELITKFMAARMPDGTMADWMIKSIAQSAVMSIKDASLDTAKTGGSHDDDNTEKTYRGPRAAETRVVAGPAAIDSSRVPVGAQLA